jgi:membrane protein YqaA with SNARE-associated domain
MREAIDAIAAWVQGWLGEDAGLLGLFVSALLSATILPGSSEVVMIGLLTAYPQLAWQAFAVATIGNVIGCVLTYGMGYAARQGYERFQRVGFRLSPSAVSRLQRFGPPALFLAFLPLVGDALVLAAGWLRLPFMQSLWWMACGKAARYLVLVLSMLGLLTFF